MLKQIARLALQLERSCHRGMHQSGERGLLLWTPQPARCLHALTLRCSLDGTYATAMDGT